jgi:hypothetical protein
MVRGASGANRGTDWRTYECANTCTDELFDTCTVTLANWFAHERTNKYADVLAYTDTDECADKGSKQHTDGSTIVCSDPFANTDANELTHRHTVAYPDNSTY